MLQTLLSWWFRSRLRWQLLLFIAVAICLPTRASAQAAPQGEDRKASVVKMPVEVALKEEHLWQLRLRLPNHLHVSGHSVPLPSGRVIPCSMLNTLVLQQQVEQKWTLRELADALKSERPHVRCAALLLLVSQTGFHEDHPALLMSREELAASGVLARWERIAAELSEKR